MEETNIIHPPALEDAGDSATARSWSLTKRGVIVLLALFCASRLWVLGVGVLADRYVPKRPDYRVTNGLLDLFVRWDAGWYLNIVNHGYFYRSDAQSSVGFYPFYPLLVWLVKSLGIDPVVAGYVVSNLALLGASALLWKLARFELRSETAANFAVAFLLFAPGSDWFSMIYAESLFVLLFTAQLYACRRGRWGWAAAAGYGLALTRPPGLVTAVFPAIEAVQQWRERRLALSVSQAGMILLAAAAPVLGYATLLGFLQVRFGDWRAQFKTVAAGWPRTGPQNFWLHLQEFWTMQSSQRWVVGPLTALALVLCAACVPALRRWSYAAVTATLLVLYLVATEYERLPRYLSVVVPLYLVLAAWAGQSRRLGVIFLAGSVVLLTVLTAAMIAGYPIF